MSVIQKNKVTKKIWFKYRLWDVVQILTPTRYDCYILVKRKRTDQTHGNGINPINMALIDCSNDEFYPDTKEVRILIERNKKNNADMDDNTEKLSSIWLKLFKRR